MSETPVPRLDLAPKRKKPLSLWNPLDYLVLLYWVFFFPQALRWYVERFGKPEYQESKGDGNYSGSQKLYSPVKVNTAFY